jgi:AP-1 complex subunit beta-1
MSALKNLISDSNPTVVSSAIIALLDIDSKSDDFNFQISLSQASTLVTALNECSEWGQTYILEALMRVVPKAKGDAESLIERLQSRMQHANSAVVLTCIKVIIYLMNYVQDEDIINNTYRKMAPPLVTLTSAEPEIQYVALKNILLIVQKRPELLQNDMRVFFCKYNDPIYVKLSKLEILFRLANESNVDLMLSELKEYAQEVDVDFVRKAVRSIGRCAIKIESSADRCIASLVELIQSKVNYVVQEAIVVIRDIFRKYPNRYESIIGVLCENLDGLDEPEAKSAMIWIIGHYCDRIGNSHDLLETFIEPFTEEPAEVQLSLLTAAVKLFAKKPSESFPLVKKLLNWATENTDNPDVRDRGFFYWRLLSHNPSAVNSILFSERPPISTATDNLDPQLLRELMLYLNTLASIYHKPPRTLFTNFKESIQNVSNSGVSQAAAQAPNPMFGTQQQQYNPYGADNYNAMNQNNARQANNLLDIEEPEPEPQNAGYGFYDTGKNDYNQFNVSSSPQIPDNIMDQLGQLGLGGTAMGSASSGASLVAPKQVFLAANIAKGLEIQGTFARRQGRMFMEMTFTNRALQPLSDFAIQFNKNTFGLLPGSQLQVRSPLPPNQSAETSLLIGINPATHAQPSVPLNNLQVAIKNNAGVFFFQTLVPFHITFSEEGKLAQQEFVSSWQATESSGVAFVVDSLNFPNIDSLRTKLAANNVFIVAERQAENRYSLYLSSKAFDNTVFLTELVAPSGVNGSINVVNVTGRSEADSYLTLFLESLEAILRS